MKCWRESLRQAPAEYLRWTQSSCRTWSDKSSKYCSRLGLYSCRKSRASRCRLYNDALRS
nr:MAG TPA: hypothetical protein [Caudoviricetes sp.]